LNNEIFFCVYFISELNVFFQVSIRQRFLSGGFGIKASEVYLNICVLVETGDESAEATASITYFFFIKGVYYI